MVKKKRINKKECIIKRKGYEEFYDEKKVYASVYSAALNCEYTEKKAEKIALNVMEKCSEWVRKESKNNSIYSDKIRDFVLKTLKDKDVKLMYEHHLDLS